MRILIILVSLILCSCLGPKRNWSKAKYKTMLWEFAISLEKNYSDLQLDEEFDSNGKRVVKSIFPPDYHKKPNVKKQSYLDKIQQDKVYDPEAHKNFK